MSHEERLLVQGTFALIKPGDARFAPQFYARLFEVRPALRKLFKDDLRDQGRKLMQMLAFCVHGLDHLDELGPAVRDLGRRHADYGTTRDDYAVVGEVLLWTLEQELGARFTPAARDAWSSVYALLADLMQNAPERPRLAW